MANLTARFPLIPLPWNLRNKAKEYELVLNYDTAELYVTKPDSSGAVGDNRFVSIADAIAQIIMDSGDFSGDTILVNVDGTDYTLNNFLNNINNLGIPKFNLNASTDEGKMLIIDKDSDGKLTLNSVAINDLSSQLDLSDKADKKKPATTNNIAVLDANGNLADGGKTIASINSEISGKLSKSGGSLTGFLTLHADPTSNMHAATKKYTDNLVDSLPWKKPVSTYSVIATTYPNPDYGDTVTVLDTNIDYRYTEGSTSWSSGPSTNNEHYNHSAAGTTSNALVVPNGQLNNGSTKTELFNGTSWSFGPECDQVLGGYGHSTTGLANSALTTGGTDGGMDATFTSLFNGTSWSSVVDMSNERSSHSSVGVVNSALVMGGTYTSSCEKFNGTSWSTNPSLPTTYYSTCAVGVSNNALLMGGQPTYKNHTLKFNGTTWSNIASLNENRYGNIATGNCSNALIAGDSTSEKFNGSSWSIAENMIKNRKYHAGVGTFNDVITNGGLNNTNTTEKYGTIADYWAPLYSTENVSNGASPQYLDAVTSAASIKNTYTDPKEGDTVTALDTFVDYRFIDDHDEWFYAASMNKTRFKSSAVATPNNALDTGGIIKVDSSITDTTELFNGSSWNMSVSMNIPRSGHKVCGSTDNAIVAGGSTTGGSSYLNTCEKFNGIVWGSCSSLNAARESYGMIGYPGSAVVAGGVGNSSTNSLDTTELFNGDLWFIGPAINTKRNAPSAAGTDIDGILTGGMNSNTYLANTELYNGNQWSSGIDMNVARAYHSVCGLPEGAFAVGGSNSSSVSYSATTEKCNGVAWTTSAEMNSARYTHSIVGNAHNALVAGCTEPTEIYRYTRKGWYSLSEIAKISGMTEASDIVTKADKKVPSSVGNIATLDAYGNLTDGGKTIDSINTEISSKVDKKKPATTNNIAVLDANGNLEDGGKTIDSINTEISSKISKLTDSVDGNVIVADDVGGIYDSGIKIDNMMLKSGGAFKGPVTLYSYPIENMEVANKGYVDESLQNIQWKAPVSTYSSISSTYPNPQYGDTTTVLDTNIDYRYTKGSELWSMSANTNISQDHISSTGTTSSTLLVPNNSISTTLEKFNGTVWYNSTSYNKSLYDHCTVGTSNSALIICGTIKTGGNSKKTFLFNGNTCSVLSRNTNVEKGNHCAVGVSNSADTMFGDKPNHEKFNGSTWSIISTEPESGLRMNSAAVGRDNNILAICGADEDENQTQSVLHYNGIIWSMNSSTNSSREYHTAFGVPNATIISGGISGLSNCDTCENFNGYVWKTSINMNKVRAAHGAAGNMDSGFAICGTEGSNTTEIYTKNLDEWIPYSIACNKDASSQYLNAVPSVSDLNITYKNPNEGDTVTVLDTGTDYRYINNKEEWSMSSALLNVGTYAAAMCGTYKNALIIGGRISTDADNDYLNRIEKFDGYTWHMTDLTPTTPEDLLEPNAVGSTNNVLMTTENYSYGYNGLTWITLSDLPSSKIATSMIGNTANALRIGGTAIANGVAISTPSQLYDGNSWSVSPHDLNVDRSYFAACGAVYNGVVIGGINNNDSSIINDVERYNGYDWFALESLPISVNSNAATGTFGSCIEFTGELDDSTSAYNSRSVFELDGGSWSAKSCQTIASRRKSSACAATYKHTLLAGGLGDEESNTNALCTCEIYIQSSAGWYNTSQIENNDDIQNNTSAAMVGNFGSTTLKIYDVTISSTGWNLDNNLNLYYYDYTNGAIDSKSSVSINIPLEMIEYSALYGIYPCTQSDIQKARIFASTKPEVDITGCTIIIIK